MLPGLDGFEVCERLVRVEADWPAGYLVVASEPVFVEEYTSALARSFGPAVAPQPLPHSSRTS
jgi:CheY-like chemotaxis protein